MKPINEVIADLEARGFVLPEGLQWAQGIPRSYRTTFVAGRTGRWESIADAIAIDAIACEFARQARRRLCEGSRGSAKAAGLGSDLRFELGLGDSEAALRALWEATQ